MGAGGEEDEEEKGGKVGERRPGFFFFVNEGAADPAMAAKVLLHPLSHWVIDSGSSWHMTPRVDLLDEIQPAPIATVTSATGAKAKVMGMGRAMFVGADGELVGLKEVLWVPDLCANLISTGRLGDAGVNTETIGSERYRAYKESRLIWDLQRNGGVHRRMWQIPVLPWPKGNEPAAAAAVEGAMDDEDHEECDEGLIAAAGAMWAVHLGMAPDSKGWLMWDPRSKKTIVSRDVKFVENVMYNDWQQQQQVQIGLRLQELQRSAVEEVQPHLDDRPGSELTSDHSGGVEQPTVGDEPEEGLEDESTRVDSPSVPMTSPPARADESDNEESAFCFFTTLPSDPATLHEAWTGPLKAKWKPSTDEEFNSLIENETWDLVNLPKGRRAIGNKWVFRTKTGADGEVERYKSRLVAKGFEQKEKEDYKEVFAPVAKTGTLKTLLAIAAVKGWSVKQMDIITAFLNGVVVEDIYMEQPVGYEDGTGRVCKLKKAIYGLKQAPRTPLPADFKLRKATEDDVVLEEEEMKEYHSLIGSVIKLEVKETK
ncbi:hypothetical protein CLOM_g11054 [Closterium sp. NIES-68]|nr:hypothetical protein CLOM_g11054 [Closterium sp. NIES-68]